MDAHYEKRLKTFENWTSVFPKSKIVLAGFIYTGQDDIVKCPICELEVCNWRVGDDPTADHLRWSPDCLFFNDDDSLFIRRKRKPLHTDKITLESRLKTFEGWPPQISQKPEELAKAGFYYTGKGDQVLCFHCGLGLKDWGPGDIIWEQHALFYSKCEFYQLKSDSPPLVAKEISLSVKEVQVEQVKTCSSDKILCKICLENESCVVFMPCKHMACCSDCSINFNKCIICRQNITSFLKIFIS